MRNCRGRCAIIRTMKNGLNKILLAVVIVLLVVLVVIVGWKYIAGGPSYYAVYLRTGDLYFGELSTFPSFSLSHVYMLQVNSQNQQNPVSIQKFTNVFWGPEDSISINRNEVVWYTRLASDSKLAQLVQSNPSLTPSTDTTQTPPASTSTPGTTSPQSGK